MDKIFKSNLINEDPIHFKLYYYILINSENKKLLIQIEELINKLNFKNRNFTENEVKIMLEKLKEAELINFTLCNNVILIEIDFKNNKVPKNKKNNPDCEYIWNLYPIKKGKKIAINKINNLLKEYSKNQIIEAIGRFKKEILIERIENKYIPHGSTFFTTKIYDYFEENKVNNNSNIHKNNIKLLTIEDLTT